MKVGDLVKRASPLRTGRKGLGVVLELLFDDYWGDTAVVWWDNETKYEHELRHLEVVDGDRRSG